MSQVKTARAYKARNRALKEPLFVCGDYRLYAEPGRSHRIHIYNPDRGADDKFSAGTTDLEQAKTKVLQMFHGDGHCKACGQALPKETEGSDLIANIIETYLTVHVPTAANPRSIEDRIAHMTRYIAGKDVRVGHVDEAWIAKFREWLTTEPYYAGKGENRREKFRKHSTAEGCVVQLASAIRKAGLKPLFEPKQFRTFDGTPDFRADVPLIAAMFRWCLMPDGPTEKERARKRAGRANVLAFLRLAVATWARPDAILDASLTPAKRQWVSDARVFRLNPIGRPQTRKHRPIVPVPEIVGQWLDTLPAGPILSKQPSKATWRRMMDELKPGLAEGEGGWKLIRRSMASMVLKRVGLENEVQVEKMLGHCKFKVSDLYTLPEPALLGRALAATTAICEEIEDLCAGAFSPNLVPQKSNVVAMGA